MKRLIVLLILLESFAASAQVSKIDSLYAIDLTTAHDTIRAKLYIQLAGLYKRVSFDSMYSYGHKAHELSIKNNFKRGEARANLMMGISHWKRGNLLPGLDLCQAALDISVANNFRDIEAEALDNVGLIYNYLGDYPTALENYQRGLAIAEELKLTEIKANILSNLGGLHYNLKDYDRALDFWKRTLDLREQLGDKAAAGSSMNNIGLAYSDKGDYIMSLPYFLKSLRTFEAAGLSCDRVYPLENMGVVYIKIKKLDTAEYYLKEALTKAEACSNRIVEVGILTELADVYKIANQYKSALPILEKAFKIARTSRLNREAAIAAKSLSEVHEKLGNTREAFAVFKTYQAIQDSLYNNENAKAIGKLEAQNEYELAKRDQEVKQQLENLAKEKVIAREKWVRNTFIGGFVVMIVVAFMTYRNFQKKKISNLRLELLNREINEQKSVLVSQAEELRSLNESLNNINHDLEEKIAERTRQLIDKNSELENKNVKLADYAFINAHKLRAPVATILGLVTLFENKQVDNQERDEIVQKIKNCSEELNAIVREIRVTLEREKMQG